MPNNDNAASKIAEICLTKCGFVRNLQPILEALEEQIYGNGGALNANEFETSDDYANMRYGGVASTSLDLISNGVINRNIECQFNETEIDWLNALSIEKYLHIETLRKDLAIHNIKIVLDIPLSPTKASTKKVRVFVKIENTKWKSSDLSVSAIVSEADEVTVSKALTLYALS